MKHMSEADFRRLFRNIQATRKAIPARDRKWVNKVLKEITRANRI